MLKDKNWTEMVAAARATQTQPESEELIIVLRTFHDEMSMYHLRQTYRLRNVWEHQEATNAHRAAHRAWRKVHQLHGEQVGHARGATEKALVLSETAMGLNHD